MVAVAGTAPDATDAIDQSARRCRTGHVMPYRTPWTGARCMDRRRMLTVNMFLAPDEFSSRVYVSK